MRKKHFQKLSAVCLQMFKFPDFFRPKMNKKKKTSGRGSIKTTLLWMWSMVPEKSKLTNLANIAKKRCLFANGNGSGHTSQMRSMKRMAILRTTLKSMEGMPLDTEMRYYDISMLSIFFSYKCSVANWYSNLDTYYTILDTQ